MEEERREEGSVDEESNVDVAVGVVAAARRLETILAALESTPATLCLSDIVLGPAAAALA